MIMKDRSGRFPRLLAAVAGLLLVAGCGVKSEPAFPEGSSYPRAYPAGAPKAKEASDQPTQPRAASPAPAAAGDIYSPPPAATDPNFR